MKELAGIKSPDPDQNLRRRGIAQSDVAIAADALLREGVRPTIERVRARLGRGSPNTINPLLDDWWRSLASRLSGGPEAFERIPPGAFHVMEALWVQLQIAARDQAETFMTRKALGVDAQAQALEVRSTVLSLREAELNDRLARSEERAKQLQDMLAGTGLSLRKAQARLDAAEQREKILEAELEQANERLAGILVAAVRKERGRKPVLRQKKARRMVKGKKRIPMSRKRRH
jgi:hypothetical protein